MGTHNFPTKPFRKLLSGFVSISLLLMACGVIQRVSFPPTPESAPGLTTIVETPVETVPTLPSSEATPPPALVIETTPETGTTGETVTPDEPQATSEPTSTFYRLVLPYAAGPESIAGTDWRLVGRVIQKDLDELNFNLYIHAPAIEPEISSAAVSFNREVQTLVEMEVDEVQTWLGDTPVEGPGGFEQIRYLVTSAPGWEAGVNSSVYFEGSGEMSGEQATLQAGGEILSVLFEVISYTGGAHPGSIHRVLNYDLAARKPLSLGDLFKAEADFLGMIHAYCVEALRQRPEMVFPEFEQYLAPVAEHYRVWSLSPQGILITFEEYHVAPYAAGPQQVLVPFSVLENILDPSGPLGVYAK